MANKVARYNCRKLEIIAQSSLKRLKKCISIVYTKKLNHWKIRESAYIQMYYKKVFVYTKNKDLDPYKIRVKLATSKLL